MIELNPVPLYWRISELSLRRLAWYQMKYWGFNLEMPPMPNAEAYRIAPIILTTEEASRLMKQTRRHFK